VAAAAGAVAVACAVVAAGAVAAVFRAAARQRVAGSRRVRQFASQHAKHHGRNHARPHGRKPGGNCLSIAKWIVAAVMMHAKAARNTGTKCVKNARITATMHARIVRIILMTGGMTIIIDIMVAQPI